MTPLEEKLLEEALSRAVDEAATVGAVPDLAIVDGVIYVKPPPCAVCTGLAAVGHGMCTRCRAGSDEP